MSYQAKKAFDELEEIALTVARRPDRLDVLAFLQANEGVVRNMIASVIYRCSTLDDDDAIEFARHAMQPKSTFLVDLYNWPEIQEIFADAPSAEEKLVYFPFNKGRLVDSRTIKLSEKLDWRLQKSLLEIAQCRIEVMAQLVLGIPTEIIDLLFGRYAVLLSSSFYHQLLEEKRAPIEEVATYILASGELSEAFMFQLLLHRDFELFTEILWQTATKVERQKFDRNQLQMDDLILLLEQTKLNFSDIGRIFLETALVALPTLEAEQSLGLEDFSSAFAEETGVLVSVIWDDLPDLLVELLNQDPPPDWSKGEETGKLCQFPQ